MLEKSIIDDFLSIVINLRNYLIFKQQEKERERRQRIQRQRRKIMRGINYSRELIHR